MKAKDLMLFDLVKRNKDGKVMTVVELRYAETIAAITPDDVYYGDMEDYHESEIDPIPLTTEILEKNGFKSWEHGYIWKERVGMGGQTTSASSPIEIIIYEGGHSVIINPHAGKEFQGSIDNVHELQHALKLCGINKEIVI